MRTNGALVIALVIASHSDGVAIHARVVEADKLI